MDRTLVSFQGNRKLPFYRWLKYKEGFSAEFVRYAMEELTDSHGVLLDPFAGTGTALFAARKAGWDAIGIELLPVGFFAMEARIAAERVKPRDFARELERIDGVKWESYFDAEHKLAHVPISRGAFPRKTERSIAGYRAYCSGMKNASMKKLFELACLSVLESVSYTRKDGQYLRWDRRAGRERTKSNFDKGQIAEFDSAIRRKLREICTDLRDKEKSPAGLFEQAKERGKIGTLDLRRGSCLEMLPHMEGESIDLVLTSPPYCNRYDYTRTYALELVYLGVSAEELKTLRQNMLSCTVENRTKVNQLRGMYERCGQKQAFGQIMKVFEGQKALQEVLGILEELGAAGELNNTNIPNMVRNYFLEMAFVIYELGRILRPGGRIVMVNDNVRYAGEEIPVDLILSDFSKRFGMRTKTIWTLARGKGNSSQQMGSHGRSELRKCVYVWEKD
ncbi:MAG: site-specific DNA-methyltransferase [Phycisphaerae bacterium]|nr:site-specific DNA-methyltransferase [Phycisphaerae bacterium]